MIRIGIPNLNSITRSLLSCMSILIFSFLIISCRNQENFAPVTSSKYMQHHSSYKEAYQVKPHDTLYSIAFRYDTDFHKLAELNHIQSPYTVKTGQIIYLQTPVKRQTQHMSQKPFRTVRPRMLRPHPAKNIKKPVLKQVVEHNTRWIWPIKGRVVKRYAPNQNRKGIDIAGHRGDHVKASAQGVVAYSGSGLPGYGNLIIIKHESNFLTAYSHNETNLVKEGQHIQKGQLIAKIGMIDGKFYGLHYEIRKSGHPVNPLLYLK